MAAKYYGVAIGGDMKGDVTTGSSTTSSAFEFVVANTTASGQDKAATLKALEAIRQAVIADTYPAA